ncbi:cytochrome P450 [Pseudarthrobacter sp. MDT3-26]|uniref:cytochrome P450 n=1 Tax=Pseudarthrobacter raffinosi TaxID=2953651 RepID=UPI00208E011A|nr:MULTISPECIES: cytochrome P450 [unclassified Pseudarthrobacter]MCO4236392.1 cytochrome P450 [Pseudarthrobacter sp. MDT3-28]MCO4262317.1 cytochrome P450 [Pseudarthrobacter sp. MDT3-26]
MRQTEGSDGARCPYLVVRDPDAVREVLHRPADFSPANALVAVTPLEGPALRVLQRVRFALPPVLASNDTDTHAGIRKVVAGFFTPATVAAMEPRIRELAQEAARNAADQLGFSGSVDLVQAVAAFPPAVVMLELLGLPVRDLADLKRWGRESMELFWGWPDQDRQLELAHSAADFYVWLRKLVAESRAAPGRNLFKSLAEHGLSTTEICSLGYFLLIAGQETTTQLISTTLFRLLEGSAPVGWKDAASDAGSRAMVRHVLATESSVPTWRRVAAHDTNLGDARIPSGTEILLELSGNQITSPAALASQSMPAETAHRGQSTSHGIVFGSGIHRCLGAKLAELEAALVVQETATALTDVQLQDHQPDWIRLLSFQAPRTVTVANGPRSFGVIRKIFLPRAASRRRC